MGWETMELERSGPQVRVACRGALFHHGVGGAVKKGVVGLPGLLTGVFLLQVEFFSAFAFFCLISK